jgi:methanogenic corrinoid protein MtbC1
MAVGFRTRALTALHGELPEKVPYAPRLDLWHAARVASGTLPAEHAGRSPAEICRAEGWGVYRLTADYSHLESADEHQALCALGLYAPPGCGYRLAFDSAVDIAWRREGDRLSVDFETAHGHLHSVVAYTDEMRRNGITYPWVAERPLKELGDWRVVAELFDALRLVPDPEDYERVRDAAGEDAIVAIQTCDSASPMHHILKHFLPGTGFYLLYADRRRELEQFAEALAPYYEQLLGLCATADVDAVSWGGNYDDTITYPPFFAEQILPWLQRASGVLRARGIPLLSHCDGENRGLLRLIPEAGLDAAESLCPYPLTSVPLDEYYERWAGELCLVGGIPATCLIAEQTSDDELVDYLRYVLRAVAPGRRFIAGITDAVPPAADLGRLRLVHEFFERHGSLPLPAGPVPAIFGRREPGPGAETAPVDAEYAVLQEAVLAGRGDDVAAACRGLLDAGRTAEDVLERGLVAAMDVAGRRFAAGELFIPDLLLAARAMQAGAGELEESLTGPGRGATRSSGTVVLGTVKGDLHDIGKNLVAMLLTSVGFEVVDLGTDVDGDAFVAEVRRRRPQLVGLSALLTTTMPRMPEVIAALEAAGLRRQVRVLVGGAPVTEAFAQEIGADGYGRSAGEAMAVARCLAREAAGRGG